MFLTRESLDLEESSGQSQSDLIHSWSCPMMGKIDLMEMDVRCVLIQGFSSLIGPMGDVTLQ